MTLCAAISNYMRQREYIEQEVFKFSGNFLRYYIDLKPICHFDCTSSLIADKMPRILEILFKDMNLLGVEMMFKELEAFCSAENLPVDENSSATKDLQQSIECVRDCLIAYIARGTCKSCHSSRFKSS